jgi:hypothetical protein
MFVVHALPIVRSPQVTLLAADENLTLRGQELRAL